ncbi:hypothetical protein [Arenimonas oryziterrae]|uniref:Organic solvent tolerance-like N-terminal domain-containing protein n=1 Tax=Arenimonas oryziterrae DSM 21050 = YC6267 TaxID=1121015 RepID=A0A091AQ64_9GAMM|nr:hypothetical protein [Arenimonas oryziterrae]KFN41149.1 hypothetical protein N789_04485 [Arenimonas oryziterrae DSM 21050 = YC6267]
MRLATVVLMSVAALAVAAPVAAVEFPKRADALPVFVPAGMTIETQLEADLNKDGIADTAAVIRGEDVRYLLVAVREGKGLRRVGLGEIDAYPLGNATLTAPKGVLLIEDLTGGTSAVFSKYRYRYDAASDRMQLIGDDVTYYSRTNQHDAIEISTNRVTGARITQVRKLTGENYVPQKPKQTKVKVQKLYLETAPVAEDTLGIGG